MELCIVILVIKLPKPFYKEYYIVLYEMYTFIDLCLIDIDMQRSNFIEIVKYVH